MLNSLDKPSHYYRITNPYQDIPARYCFGREKGFSYRTQNNARSEKFLVQHETARVITALGLFFVFQFLFYLSGFLLLLECEWSRRFNVQVQYTIKGNSFIGGNNESIKSKLKYPPSGQPPEYFNLLKIGLSKCLTQSFLEKAK